MSTVPLLPSPAHPRNARQSCSGALLAPSQPAPCPLHRQTSLRVFSAAIRAQSRQPGEAAGLSCPRAGRVAPSRAAFPVPGHGRVPIATARPRPALRSVPPAFPPCIPRAGMENGIALLPPPTCPGSAQNPMEVPTGHTDTPVGNNTLVTTKTNKIAIHSNK